MVIHDVDAPTAEKCSRNASSSADNTVNRISPTLIAESTPRPTELGSQVFITEEGHMARNQQASFMGLMVSGPVSRKRAIVGSALALVMCAVSTILMFGLIDLGTALGLSDPQYEWQMSLEVSWGSMFTFLIGGGFAWVCIRPHHPQAGLLLLAIVAVSLAVGAAALMDQGPLFVALSLAVVSVILKFTLNVRFERVRRGARSRSWLRTSIATAGALLWLGYAVLTSVMARSSASGVGDVTNGIDHWPVQVALGVAIASGAAIVALRADAWGAAGLWRWMFALSAIAVGSTGLAYPDRLGAMPHPVWGIVMVLWGLSLVLIPGPRPTAWNESDITKSILSAPQDT